MSESSIFPPFSASENTDVSVAGFDISFRDYSFISTIFFCINLARRSAKIKPFHLRLPSFFSILCQYKHLQKKLI